MSTDTAVAARPVRTEVQEAKGEITYTPFASADQIKLSIAIVQKWLCKPTSKGAICSESDAMRLMMLCRARRLNPWEGDAFIVGYDGRNGPEFSVIAAHQALLKRCEPQPTFQGMDSGVIVSPGIPCKACDDGFQRTADAPPKRCEFCRGSGVIDEIQGDFVPEGQRLIGGWAHLIRSDRSIPYHRRLSVDAYKPPYQNKFWDSNAAGQIVKCAEADCMRSAYPTLVGGLYPEGDNGFSIVTRDAGAVPSMIAPPPTQKLASPQRREIAAPPQRIEHPRNQAPVQSQDDDDLGPQAAVESNPLPTTSPGGPELSETQQQLSEVVASVGGSFEEFRTWASQQYGSGDATMGILAWDTYSGYEDVPEKVAKLCVRAKAQLIAELKGEGK